MFLCVVQNCDDDNNNNNSGNKIDETKNENFRKGYTHTRR